MKPIAKLNLKFNDVYYDKGEELKVENKEQLIWLNEHGFIEPLTPKEIQDFFKKEDLKDGFNTKYN